jgi:arginine/lysine/ornithine decarboxylase
MTELDPSRAPLFERMVAHQRQRNASFHVPGHKGRQLDAEAAPFFGSLLSLDLTEITGLDDLHQPEEAIKEAQELAAACFGAEQTFFLVGGSTAGNLAMILSTCARGELLLVQRNAHKSVLHGLMLAGAKAVFLPPRWDTASGLATGVDPDDVREALRRYPEARGLLITNPNYYGLGMHLRELADLLHAHGKPLLVDEAHGAHYGFHPALPPSALSCGADAVVQSTHKMLTAMTMGAMLHLQGSLIDREAVAKCLTMIQSSSPSYPIMASLDLARRQMHTQGPKWIRQGLDAVAYFLDKLDRLPCYETVKPNPGRETGRPSYDTKDPFKVTLSDATGTLSGTELQAQLERRGCYAEMATPHHVLLLFSLASTLEDAERAYRALEDICGEFGLQKKELPYERENIHNVPRYTRVSPPISFDLPFPVSGKSEQASILSVHIDDAVGRRSAEMVIPYPPGIPVLFPGEPITAETAAYLQELAASGTRFHGTASGKLEYIQVMQQQSDHAGG